MKVFSSLHGHETWTYHSSYDVTSYTSHLSSLSPLSQASHYILRQGVQWPWLLGQTFSHQRTKLAVTYNPTQELAGSPNGSCRTVGSPRHWQQTWQPAGRGRERPLPGRQPEVWRVAQTSPEVESPTGTFSKSCSESQRITLPGDTMGRIQRITVSVGELSNITKDFSSKPSDQR